MLYLFKTSLPKKGDRLKNIGCVLTKNKSEIAPSLKNLCKSFVMNMS